MTSIKIADVNHEFTSIKGITEDVTEIALNIKNLVVRLEGSEPKTMKVSANKAGVVTAADIVADPAIEVASKEAVLVTLTENVNFEMEMVVENGRGYMPASERIAAEDRFDQEIGRILLDAVYSPVTPEMALVEAAKILRKHINPFVQYFKIGEQTVTTEIMESEDVSEEQEIDEELAQKLNIPIAELELSVRANNCLESAKIETVGQLAKMAESDLLKIRSFGKTSLREIKRKLADIGLSLGMTDI